jgi:aldehyde:ferredoxin oxidoreductase
VITGVAGRILHVDLTVQMLRVETPPEDFYRKYMGGSAMGLYYILKHMPARADPLGPDNVLTMMLSPLVGAPISGQSRMTVNARSPLVDGVGDGQAGGFFPAEMKFAGFDGVVVSGQARSPVYLWLHEGHAELRDAAHLWGRTTSEVEQVLKQELRDDRIEIAQCGPAGERLARLAAIINMANRANGRTGWAQSWVPSGSRPSWCAAGRGGWPWLMQRVWENSPDQAPSICTKTRICGRFTNMAPPAWSARSRPGAPCHTATTMRASFTTLA